MHSNASFFTKELVVAKEIGSPPGGASIAPPHVPGGLDNHAPWASGIWIDLGALAWNHKNESKRGKQF